MLNELRQRIIDALARTELATLATTGLAGLQVTTCACEARQLMVYLYVPKASEHLVNIGDNPTVIVSTNTWRLRAKAHVLRPEEALLAGVTLDGDRSEWYALLELKMDRFEFIYPDGSGAYETIDLE